MIDFLIVCMRDQTFWVLDYVAIKKMAHKHEGGYTINFTGSWLRKTKVKQLIKLHHLKFFDDYKTMITWLKTYISSL